MSKAIESDEALHGTLGDLTKVLVAQALALDEMFYRAAREAYSTDEISSYHARKALKAQARCRATFKVLLALRKSGDADKFSDLSVGTIQTLKAPCSANTLAKLLAQPAAATPARPPKRRARRACTRWSPERRARQALAIRTWQPWRKSTGPRTEAGKARSCRNALKHGQRSKAFAETRREEGRILAVSASNLSIARGILRAIVVKPPVPLTRTLSTRAGFAPSFRSNGARPAQKTARPAGFHSIDIGSATRALIPSRVANYPGIAARRHPPPADKASPRRGWRIAS